MKITTKEIAQLAGVSQGAVSRVLNNAPIRVSQKTRDKILKIAKELNYTPNYSARSLKTGEHNSIAVITYDITDAFASECIEAMESYLENTKYRAQWISCKHAHRTKTDPIRLLTEFAQTSDAIIVILANNYLTDKDILKFWASASTPIFSVIRSIPGEMIPSVTIDNTMGTTLLMDHLRKLNHSKIAFCYCNYDNPSASDRFTTYKDLIKEYSLPIDSRYYIPVDGTIQGGYKAGSKLIKLNVPPTAVIGFNDLTAIGLMKAFYEKKINIPHEISIASFDNLNICPYLTPSLTSVGVNFNDIAKTAINSIIEKNTTKKNITLKPKLFARQSTVACPD